MHALLIGATGATGNDLLKLLLQDETFTRVDVFVRRRINLTHAKLHVHVIEFDKPEQWKLLVKGDVLFSCLGTTLKKAGSRNAQWKIDYGYQYQFATSARENNVPTYILVSADFASSNSIFHYAKMKGKLDEAVKALNFKSLSIFKPPILVRKNTDRALEALGVNVLKILNGLGIFKKQTPLPTEVLARAMIVASKRKVHGFSEFKPNQILQLADAEV